MPEKVVYTPQEIWNAPTRLLTQTQFPFWKAVLMPTDVSILTPGAGITVDKDIVPVTGETWLIHLLAGFQGEDNETTIKIGSYDGTTFTPMTFNEQYHSALTGIGGYGHLGLSMVIDSSLYARIEVVGGADDGYGAYAGYSGFVLGTRKRRSRRGNRYKPRIKDTTLPKGCYKYYNPRIDDYETGFEIKPKTPVIYEKETNTPIVFEQAYMLESVLKRIINEYIKKNKPQNYWKQKHLDKHLEKIRYYAGKLLNENI